MHPRKQQQQKIPWTWGTCNSTHTTAQTDDRKLVELNVDDDECAVLSSTYFFYFWLMLFRFFSSSNEVYKLMLMIISAGETEWPLQSSRRTAQEGDHDTEGCLKKWHWWAARERVHGSLVLLLERRVVSPLLLRFFRGGLYGEDLFRWSGRVDSCNRLSLVGRWYSYELRRIRKIFVYELFKMLQPGIFFISYAAFPIFVHETIRV